MHPLPSRHRSPNPRPRLPSPTRAGPDNCEPPLNLNRAHDYQPDLGFWVAVDGAMRLPRQLPAAALITYAPPGSFYQVRVPARRCEDTKAGVVGQ